ncbi:MAG: CBS domain-containing protein [Anaeromyxobacteraceae bacterium]
MTVGEAMTRNPVSCPVEAKLGDVAKQMVEHDCGAIPIVEGGRAIGIVTDRDIVVRAVAQGRNPLECTARDAMTEGVLTVREEQDLEEAAEQMQAQQVRRAVVVDAQGKICGMLAQADIAEEDEDLAGEMVQGVSQGPGLQH